MKKIFFIFLLVLMPLQASWAVAAAYCQHESGADVRHFGHHDHQIEHGHAPDEDGDKAGTALKSDCIDCHGLCTGIFLNPPAVRVTGAGIEPGIAVSSYLPSASSSRPERPKWVFAA